MGSRKENMHTDLKLKRVNLSFDSAKWFYQWYNNIKINKSTIAGLCYDGNNKDFLSPCLTAIQSFFHLLIGLEKV